MESRRDKYRGWEIITSAAQKLGTRLCKHLRKVAVRQSVGNRYVKSRMCPRHLFFYLLYEEMIARKGEKLRSVCDFFFKLKCLNIDGYVPLVRSWQMLDFPESLWNHKIAVQLFFS